MPRYPPLQSTLPRSATSVSHNCDMRKDVIIKNSSGGMANDLFTRDVSRAHILQHYDIFTDPNKMKPHLAAENGDGSASTNTIKAFEFDGTTIWGLGTVNASGL